MFFLTLLLVFSMMASRSLCKIFLGCGTDVVSNIVIGFIHDGFKIVFVKNLLCCHYIVHAF